MAKNDHECASSRENVNLQQTAWMCCKVCEWTKHMSVQQNMWVLACIKVWECDCGIKYVKWTWSNE
jgi:hypothetical protein